MSMPSTPDGLAETDSQSLRVLNNPSGTTAEKRNALNLFSSVITTLLPASATTAALQSVSFPLVDGQRQRQTFAHNLGAVPSYTKMVLVCTSADTGSGMMPGQEADLDHLGGQVNVGTGVFLPAFGIVTDATNIYIGYSGVGGGYPYIYALTNLPMAITSLTNFSLKVYYLL